MSVVIDGTNGVTSDASFYGKTPFTGTYTDGIVVDYTTGTGRISVGTADGIKFYNGGVANTSLMELTSGGNLGLGVTPSAWTTYKALQIGPFAAYADSTTGNIDLSSNRYYASGDKYIGTGYSTMLRQSDGAFKFFTAASGTAGNAITFTQAMTLDASGNLLVGVTADTMPNAGMALQPAQGNMKFRCGNANTFTQFYNQSNTKVGSIETNGTTTSYITSSDYRLKNTVAPMTDALTKVALLKPCTYKWNADGSAGEGFIAHELQEVVPEAVSGEKDAIETYTDEDGNEQTRPKYQGIDTSFLVATLTAAIQEQQTIIEQLRADVEILKGNV